MRWVGHVVAYGEGRSVYTYIPVLLVYRPERYGVTRKIKME